MVVCLGDLYDHFSLSRFSRSHNIMTPKQEIEDGRAVAEEIFAQTRRLARNAKIILLRGNHDMRIAKSVQDKLPELAGLVDLKHLWEFDGVETIYDARQEFLYKGICFQHGFYTDVTKHVRHNNMSTVIGHTHRAEIVYHPIRNKVLWGMNCGHLADVNSAALGYTKQRWTSWTQGVGWIDDYGPRFIPFR